MKDGFDPMELPIDRFLNWIYRSITEGKDEKEVNKVDMEINRPLPGENPTDGVWSDEAMGAAFRGLAAELGTEV